MAQLGLAAGLRNHVSDGIVEGRLSTTLHDQCEKLDSMMEWSCWRYRERRVEVCVYNMGLAAAKAVRLRIWRRLLQLKANLRKPMHEPMHDAVDECSRTRIYSPLLLRRWRFLARVGRIP